MPKKRRRQLPGHRSTLVVTKGNVPIPWRRLLVSAALSVVAAGMIMLWFSSFLKVNVITVQGAEALSAELIHDEVAALVTGNIFSVNTKSIKQTLLERYPLIYGIDMTKRYFPNSLELTITEKKPVIAWHTGYGIYGVDMDGLVTGIASAEGLIPVYAFGAQPDLAVPQEGSPAEAPPPPATGSLILLHEGDSVASSEFIRYILDIKRMLPQQLNDPILYFVQGEHHDMSVYLESGIRVLFSTDFTLESELKRLEDTLKESENQNKVITDRVDLRFQKVYFE
ncbi:hypothetical protein AUK40_04745 [Candidatus Wirthbacteria bacterium CG2_30_54_11]|uniref:POTRA domain-containing protein n=1 Tax=Candidatus Wirthbacteria bacterium CG2_30_54_11 TaxID=1817892 RepID=A0A1J5IWH6_9BACT|nr:MAG: hypothetical protein AUK40_04745 [Candidatus Wirthbacteria bacterium CG2_30_54_11]